MTSIKTFESKHQIPVRMTRIDNPGTGIIFLDKVRKSLSQQTHGGKNIHAVIRDWGLGTLLIFIFWKILDSWHSDSLSVIFIIRAKKYFSPICGPIKVDTWRFNMLNQTNVNQVQIDEDIALNSSGQAQSPFFQLIVSVTLVFLLTKYILQREKNKQSRFSWWGLDLICPKNSIHKIISQNRLRTYLDS